MAILNLDYYKGEDRYSDGDIENEIYHIVKNNKDFDEVVLKDNRWPILYHLSHLRENILSWYSLKEDAVLLEIGAGCGALTNYFCKKVKNVKAIELTERRARINYERNKNYNNLEIIVGDVFNINFDIKFDYIVVIGVLEYAGMNNEQDAYYKFLLKLKSLLKEGGLLILAIENRLGLKYFAGSREDHTGIFFDGINEYSSGSKMRTFSKYELKDLFLKSGFQYIDFYYPYPDYKLPKVIYKENCFNLIDFDAYYEVYDTNRFKLFDEGKVINTLINENIYSNFSNSFLVFASNKEIKNNEDILYVKYSNDRDNQFRILTKLVNKNGEKKIIKQPLNEESKQHILKMYNINNNFNKINDMFLLKSSLENECLVYDYLKFQNLNSLLMKCVENNDKEEFIKLLKKFYDKLSNSAFVSENYFKSDEFKRLFGEDFINKPLLCIKPANIDVIFENIFLDGDNFITIDYEWVFDIEIPVNFILWRSLYMLYDKQKKLNDFFSLNDICSFFNIDKDEIEIYLKWLIHFNIYYVKGNTFTMNYARQELNFDFNKYEKDILSSKSSKLYIDTGNGFNETETEVAIIEDDDDVYFLYFDVSKYENINSIRWDPLDEPCYCRILNIFTNKNEPVSILYSNKNDTLDMYDKFTTNDPSYIFEGDFSNLKYIKIIFKIKKIYEEPNFLEVNFINQSNNYDILYLKKPLFYDEYQILKFDIPDTTKDINIRFTTDIALLDIKDIWIEDEEERFLKDVFIEKYKNLFRIYENEEIQRYIITSKINYIYLTDIFRKELNIKTLKLCIKFKISKIDINFIIDELKSKEKANRELLYQLTLIKEQNKQLRDELVTQTNFLINFKEDFINTTKNLDEKINLNLMILNSVKKHLLSDGFINKIKIGFNRIFKGGKYGK